MASFTSYLHEISPDPASSHPGATRVGAAALFSLLQDQFATLAASAPTEANRDFLLSLEHVLEEDIRNSPDRIQGVSQEYLDTLDRVSRKRLQSDPDGTCMICAEKFLDDPHPLVVELPCHGTQCVFPSPLPPLLDKLFAPTRSETTQERDECLL